MWLLNFNGFSSAPLEGELYPSYKSLQTVVVVDHGRQRYVPSMLKCNTHRSYLIRTQSTEITKISSYPKYRAKLLSSYPKYGAKLLFHQSPTRHCDYTVTGKWRCSHVVNWWQHGDYTVDDHSWWSTVQSSYCQQLSTVTTPSLSVSVSHCVVTVPSSWQWNRSLAVLEHIKWSYIGMSSWRRCWLKTINSFTQKVEDTFQKQIVISTYLFKISRKKFLL